MADDRKLSLIKDTKEDGTEVEVLVDTAEFIRTRIGINESVEDYDSSFSQKPGGYDEFIKTYTAEFNANINAVSDKPSIETDPKQYLNTALDYSEIQSTEDLNQFVKDHPTLSTNADVKTQLDDLNKIWDITGKEGLATGDLKGRMVATAREIANAEVLIASRDQNIRRSSTISNEAMPTDVNSQMTDIKQAVDTPFIKTNDVTFNTNINAMKNTRVIVEDADTYQTIANDYATIKTTKDLRDFVQNNELLLANPTIKSELDKLTDIWVKDKVSSPATGDLKVAMEATAQKIANAEFTIIDHAKTKELADALNAANSQAKLEQLAKNQPLLEGAVLLKQIQLTVKNMHEVNPSLQQTDGTQEIIKLDGAKAITDTGVLPQSDAKTVGYYNDLKTLEASAAAANEIASRHKEQEQEQLSQ